MSGPPRRCADTVAHEAHSWLGSLTDWECPGAAPERDAAAARLVHWYDTKRVLTSRVADACSPREVAVYAEDLFGAMETLAELAAAFRERFCPEALEVFVAGREVFVRAPGPDGCRCVFSAGGGSW